MNVYDIPKNEQVLDELYVVLSQDKDGTEGIVSAFTPMGAMPMVFGHHRMLGFAKKQAKVISKETGRTLVIAKYKKSEILETITA